MTKELKFFVASTNGLRVLKRLDRKFLSRVSFLKEGLPSV